MIVFFIMCKIAIFFFQKSTYVKSFFFLKKKSSLFFMALHFSPPFLLCFTPSSDCSAQSPGVYQNKECFV